MSPPAARRTAAVTAATTAGWHATMLNAGRFDLLALHPQPRQTDAISIFIEGDGLAWINVQTPSNDPTPLSPVALHMALREPHGIAIYLGRACQYVEANLSAQCTHSDWTHARFSREIVQAMDMAISAIKDRFGATKIRLTGYSGGGAIAALLAARRSDIVQLITVAAVLDHVS